MSTERCAVCGGDDLFASGVCAACADDGGRRQLVFLRPVDASRRGALSNRLRGWTATRSPFSLAALDEVMKGRQPLARLTAATTSSAAGDLAAQGITVLGSPVAALLLLWAASVQLRRPVLSVPRSTALLPSSTRSALAGSLAHLPPGRARSLVLDIARAGEATFASLPEPFRASGLGESVIALVGEAGSLGLETERLQVVVEAGRSDETARLRRACEDRFRLLEQTLEMLVRIAQHGAESDEGAAVDASELLGQVRAEASRRIEAEGEVSALLA